MTERLDKYVQENNTTPDNPMKWSDAVRDFVMAGFHKTIANEIVETLTGRGAREFGQTFGQQALARLGAEDPAMEDAYAYD